MSSPALEKIVYNLRFLSNLSTSRCYGVKPFTYLTLNRASSSLKYLNVYGSLTDPALEELKKHLPTVEVNKFLFRCEKTTISLTSSYFFKEPSINDVMYMSSQEVVFQMSK